MERFIFDLIEAHKKAVEVAESDDDDMANNAEVAAANAIINAPQGDLDEELAIIEWLTKRECQSLNPRVAFALRTLIGALVRDG